MVSFRIKTAAVLLQISTIVLAHGDELNSSGATGMHMDPKPSVPHPLDPSDPWNSPSYFGFGAHSTSILAHIGLMVAAWFFVLPVGVMLSVARSRFALPTQFVFLILNGVGVIFGTVYNVNTPDLYENNVHHKIGWIATWVMTAQVVMGLLFAYSGRSQKAVSMSREHAAFLAIAPEPMSPYHDYRWSGDSGHGTERSSQQSSRDISPTDPERSYRQHAKPEAPNDNDDDEELEDIPVPLPRRTGFWGNNFIDRFLADRVPGVFSSKLLRSAEIIYEIIDKTILVLGFVALATGGVTYAGIMKGNNVFNGLAHFIKGGIFVWYGLLTLGRWMGCFADLGWAWNIKPTRTEVGQWKASLPSAEFVESFVIWLYGTSNVFLEHLAAWGGEWVAQDFEHVSISIMFFGGGLCGMLIESKKIRSLLNTSIEALPPRSDVHPADAHNLRQEPRTYSFSLNPMPALIILLLGVMMSSHHQDSMVSTMVHKQWGTLFVGFALARGVTYIISYVAPPTSVFPSRPPSEFISAFCLLSGGLVFMASNKDIIRVMEERNLMAMFIFTVVMGFTSFVMAWEIIVLSIKGWAVRKEMSSTKAQARY